MAKKFVTIKCGEIRKLYLEDIARVYKIVKSKTPRLPKYNSNLDSEEEQSIYSPLTLVFRAYQMCCKSACD